MKLLITASILLIHSTSARGESFDNWYFEFFRGETKTEGKIFSPDGKLLDEGRGMILVEIDEVTGVTKSKTATKFKNRPDTVESTATLERMKENSYSGWAKDSNGGKAKLTLMLLENKKFKTVVAEPRGVTITIEGALTDDGTVTATESVHAPDGSLVVTVKTTYSKKAKKRPKVEQGAGAKDD